MLCVCLSIDPSRHMPTWQRSQQLCAGTILVLAWSSHTGLLDAVMGDVGSLCAALGTELGPSAGSHPGHDHGCRAHGEHPLAWGMVLSCPKGLAPKTGTTLVLLLPQISKVYSWPKGQGCAAASPPEAETLQNITQVQVGTFSC